MLGFRLRGGLSRLAASLSLYILRYCPFFPRVGWRLGWGGAIAGAALSCALGTPALFIFFPGLAREGSRWLHIAQDLDNAQRVSNKQCNKVIDEIARVGRDILMEYANMKVNRVQVGAAR